MHSYDISIFIHFSYWRASWTIMQYLRMRMWIGWISPIRSVCKISCTNYKWPDCCIPSASVTHPSYIRWWKQCSWQIVQFSISYSNKYMLPRITGSRPAGVMSLQLRIAFTIRVILLAFPIFIRKIYLSTKIIIETLTTI